MYNANAIMKSMDSNFEAAMMLHDKEQVEEVKAREKKIQEKITRIKKTICRSKLTEKNIYEMIDLLVENFSSFPWDIDTADGKFFGDKNKFSTVEYGVLDRYGDNEIIMPGLLQKNCYGVVNVSQDGIFSLKTFPAIGVQYAKELIEDSQRGIETTWDMLQFPLLAVREVSMSDIQLTCLDGFMYNIYTISFKIAMNKQVLGCSFKVKIRG
jgi:hypothetical protein